MDESLSNNDLNESEGRLLDPMEYIQEIKAETEELLELLVNINKQLEGDRDHIEAHGTNEELRKKVRSRIDEGVDLILQIQSNIQELNKIEIGEEERQVSQMRKKLVLNVSEEFEYIKDSFAETVRYIQKMQKQEVNNKRKVYRSRKDSVISMMSSKDNTTNTNALQSDLASSQPVSINQNDQDTESISNLDDNKSD